jgi:aerobic-type carbon monoxide dehydrogenase small subunit (CoxS/CutS family)
MKKLTLKVDGRSRAVEVAKDEPLLYVLAGQLGLKGPRFGCGLAQCGSCSVLVDGVEVRSCVTPAASLEGKEITTLEGLAKWHGDSATLHPVQVAMDHTGAPQCGYCYNGMVIKAVELLSKVKMPSDEQIRAHMNGHICRCGTYPRIIEAIRQAAETMAAEAS